MDLSKLRSITNNYQDLRLVSLRDWKQARNFEPRDTAGPYAVVQEGYDPADLKMTPDEFLLGKSGQWVPIGIFFKLPKDVRQPEFIFGTAAEIMELLSGLPSDVRIVRKDTPLTAPAEPEDDLAAALKQAKVSATPPPPPPSSRS